jgi:hypothetical protein
MLKGNYELQTSVTSAQDTPSLEEQFEREALKRLGGSIAFVSKRKFLWEGNDAPAE